MGFTKSADGVAKKGKTKGKNLGDSGPIAGIESGKTAKHGVSSMKMKEMGRNLARVANQGMRKSAGRGR
jgi:hypothetical protein